VSTIVLSITVLSITERGGSLGWASAAACIFATALGGVRWLRVAQREHYLPDSASRFALRWWGATTPNLPVALVALAGLALAARWPVTALAPAVVVALGPLGLGLKGRTSPLRWTRRLRTLAIVWAVLQGAVAAVGFLTGFAAVICCAGALAVPALVDMSCVLTAPIERRLADKYVKRATERLRRVNPKVVAITGSYGKTSTKGYVAHLLSGSMTVVASPASFNNRAGLARAVNEHLVDGTDVFVAEMGTYGRGEIAELCSWMKPDVAVITAIGPVHLERFKTEEKIVEAKSEILESAGCCVLVVDDPRLAALADRCDEAHGSGTKRVLRVSGLGPEPSVDVFVVEGPDGLEVRAHGEEIAGPVEVAARPGNVACAVAVALELGVSATEVAKRLGALPVAPHRLEAQMSPGGFVVLDDTYNSNPAGARAALAALAGAARDEGRRVVVTPGMVELGPRQREENERFAAQVAQSPADLVVIGRTNRRALTRGFGAAGSLVLVAHRDQAVAWVREQLGPGDAVLYENDVPDQYP
jgi:UDP-N-acetylmuramoyl-tripeptide--D-alanyl-D-alanine ligase